jgi:hypothetical protein
MVGFEVGRLDVVGERECVVDGLEDVLVVALEALEEIVGRDALTPDALLLFGEDVVGDPVGVVGSEELALFVVESHDFGPRASGLLVGGGGKAVEVGVDRGADPFALFVSELEGGVVALDGLFDRFDAVVGLWAETGAASAADEVLVAGAAAARSDEEEPAAAVGADEAAAEVVVVAPAALA